MDIIQLMIFDFNADSTVYKVLQLSCREDDSQILP